MDTEMWMPPKVLPAAASGLSSGQSAFGTVALTCALGKARTYKMNRSSYNDGGTTYSSVCAVNLLRLGEPDGEFVGAAIETDSHTASKVEYLPDDDPTQAGAPYVDITANVTDPVRRSQGQNLVKKIYQAESYPYAERASVRITWPQVDANFVCYTITVNPPLEEVRPR